VDGERGILLPGIPVEQLAGRSRSRDRLPADQRRAPHQKELTRFSVLLNDHSLVHEDMKIFYQNFRAPPPHGHPFGHGERAAQLYPELQNLEGNQHHGDAPALKVRTMAAMSYKISRGTVVYPAGSHLLRQFLNMMFDSPVRPYELDPDVVKALNVFLILHADHEQNCSTAAVRVVGSARVNLYAAVSAGIAAWGPLHGGANQAVIKC
jgi:citrate synthase